MLVIAVATITAMVLVAATLLTIHVCAVGKRERIRLKQQQEKAEKRVAVSMALGSIVPPVTPEIHIPAELFDEGYDNAKAQRRQI